MMKFFLFVLILTITFSCGQTKEDILQHVNPFIGTGGYVKAYPGDSLSYDSIRKNPGKFPFGGLTFPGAAVPFGMIQLSPDCKTEGFGWAAGYHYSDSSVIGFSHMHTSGNGMGFGHILFMPTIGEIQFKPGDYELPASGYRSSFSHKKEKSSPGYYFVHLNDHHIDVELTATERAGVQRYHFPGKEGNVILDLEHALGDYKQLEQSAIKIVDRNTINGYRLTKNRIKTYFTTQFSIPFDSVIFFNNGRIHSAASVTGTIIKTAFTFKNLDRPLVIKTGLSFTSQENSAQNLMAEVKGFDFDQVKNQAEAKWRAELGKVKVKGGSTDKKTIFYTALYHSSLTPFLFNDAVGTFLGADGKVHSNRGFTNYTFFTLWDTYRALHPLFTVIQQDKVDDMINSMLVQAELSQDGLLPLWCLATQNGFNMAGYSTAPVIAEAVVKNFKGFDAEKAYSILKNNAMKGGFSGHEEYLSYGYVPADDINMNVPKTLEYAYCDWNIAEIGKRLGKQDDYRLFIGFSSNFKDIFDTSIGFMRPKLKTRAWKEPFDPRAVSHQFPGNDFMESNSWQYTWHVMHDVPGLIRLMGGKEKFCKKLDELFDQPTYLTGIYAADVSGLIGQYAQGNQPSHHIAYLYALAGKPWKTQERIRQIIKQTYPNHPNGIPGNDDGGQTSAWLVFSLLGFYPVNPASATYVIGTPFFEEAIIDVGNGKTFTVRANNVSDKNIHIQSAKLNGKEFNQIILQHADLANGGTLEFEMGPKPSRWGGTDPLTNDQ